MAGRNRCELAGGAERDPRQWAVILEPHGVLFAERPSQAEAAEVAKEYGPLIRRSFDLPAVTLAPPIVVDLDARRRYRAALRELEQRGFVAG